MEEMFASFIKSWHFHFYVYLRPRTLIYQLMAIKSKWMDYGIKKITEQSGACNIQMEVGFMSS